MNKHEDGKMALSFDDISLIPQYSDVLPTEVDIRTRLFSRKSGLSLELEIPIISAAMDTITESNMARAMSLNGGLGVIHKNMSVSDQADHVSRVKNGAPKGLKVGAAISGSAGFQERASWLVNAGVDVLFFDSAHGHSKNILDSVKIVKKLWPNLFVVAGNVCTGTAVYDLAEAGADCVKSGIGAGSICTTRVVSGVGVPSFTAILDCAKAADACGVSLIADGGMKTSGDVAKAIAAGADSVMLGSMLSGSKETPGQEFEVDGILYKSYRGMGSVGAMQSGSADRYGQFSVAKDKLVPEGVEARVRVRCSVDEILYQICGGLKSSMGYLGSKDIRTFQLKSRWVQVTASGVRESHVHSVEITNSGPNYK